MCEIDWAAVSQWLQLLLQVIVVLVTFPFVKRQVEWAKGQVEEARRARELSATREILNEIGTDEIRKLRDWLLHEFDDAVAAGEGDVGSKARRIAVAYDRVAYMVKQGLVPEAALFSFQQDEIPLIWNRVRATIEEVRKERPNYCEHFRWLVEEWLPGMRTRHPTR